MLFMCWNSIVNLRSFSLSCRVRHPFALEFVAHGDVLLRQLSPPALQHNLYKLLVLYSEATGRFLGRSLGRR